MTQPVRVLDLVSHIIFGGTHYAAEKCSEKSLRREVIAKSCFSNSLPKRHTKAYLTSSRLKSTPPMGAPKATPTPLAALALRTSRRFASL